MMNRNNANISNHGHGHGSNEPLDSSASSSPTGAALLPQDAVLDRLRAMMYQEARGYDYDTYFPDPVLHLERSPLNHEWREKICQWTYNVVDTYDLPREIVSLSLNYFDRYLATRGNQCNGTLALLVSLTTLHIAMKIHSCSGTFKLQKLAELSRGQFGPRHIEQMEWQIMSALQFKLHPPTLFAYVSHYLMLFPPDGSLEVSPRHAVRKELFEVSIYMAELSVCDSFFVPYPDSLVALAALSNVMDDMPPHKMSPACKQGFWEVIGLTLGLMLPPHLGGSPRRTTQLQEAKDRLRHMFQATSSNATAGQGAQHNASNHVHGGSSNHSTASSALTSSPTSAADMMAMEDWNEPNHDMLSTTMDCGRDDRCMVTLQHADTEDEGEEEGTCFRYSPSPPTNHHAPQQSHGYQPHAGNNYQYQQRPSSEPGSSKRPHAQFRRSINSSSPTSFLAHGASPASRARMTCSPIVASVQ